MDRFWELLEDSIIVQSLVTVGVIGLDSYLYASGKDVPDTLLNITSLVLGFWFGAKTTQAAHRAYKTIGEKRDG